MKNSELKYKSWMITFLSNKEGTIELPAKDDIARIFDEEGEKWLFQEEEHENSEVVKTHYQCCLVTKIRKRKKTLLKALADSTNHPIEFIRVEKMEGSWEQAMLYCSKTEGRVGETIRSATISVEYDYSDIEFLTHRENRFPWQNSIIDELFESFPHSLKDPDDRTIYWISDETGCSGKSKLIKCMCCYFPFGTKISFGSANQLRSAAISAGPQRLYIIDVPRTLGADDSINDILSTVEDLKNGYVVSSFYGNYQKLIMKPPAIVIMSNMRCPVGKMSADRWRCYFIDQKELKYAVENKDYLDKNYSLSHEGQIIDRINEINY